MITDRFNIGSGIPVCGASEGFDINIIRELKFAGIDLEELSPSFVIRKWNLYHPVETTGSPKSLINQIGAVCRPDYIDTVRLEDAIDELQQVVQNVQPLLHLLLASAT